MDDPGDINMIEDYYYSNTTGKRAPEELGLAPRMDPDGDNVTEEAPVDNTPPELTNDNEFPAL